MPPPVRPTVKLNNRPGVNVVVVRCRRGREQTIFRGSDKMRICLLISDEIRPAAAVPLPVPVQVFYLYTRRRRRRQNISTTKSTRFTVTPVRCTPRDAVKVAHGSDHCTRMWARGGGGKLSGSCLTITICLSRVAPVLYYYCANETRRLSRVYFSTARRKRVCSPDRWVDSDSLCDYRRIITNTSKSIVNVATTNRFSVTIDCWYRLRTLWLN